MSFVDVRERVRDSPARARSLLTVRAAISSARDLEAPWSFALSLMCSYCRARLLPFWTPRGGIFDSFPGSISAYPVRDGAQPAGGHAPPAGRRRSMGHDRLERRVELRQSRAHERAQTSAPPAKIAAEIQNAVV